MVIDFNRSLILHFSSTYLFVDEIDFLIQHRREVEINAPPVPEAMQPRRVAGYCQRKVTLSCRLLIAPLHWIFYYLAFLLTKQDLCPAQV